MIIADFKEFIHKFLKVYFDDWIVFGLVKFHVASLCLLFDTYHRHQISLNLKKCVFFVPYGILLGHVVCKQGLMVDPTKIVFIINLEALKNVKQLCGTMGHIGYYRKFINEYAPITAPMKKQLKKDVTFCWDEDFQHSLDILKEKIVNVPSLVFPNWKKEFHVHVDASCIVLGAVLT